MAKEGEETQGTEKGERRIKAGRPHSHPTTKPSISQAKALEPHHVQCRDRDSRDTSKLQTFALRQHDQILSSEVQHHKQSFKGPIFHQNYERILLHLALYRSQRMEERGLVGGGGRGGRWKSELQKWRQNKKNKRKKIVGFIDGHCRKGPCFIFLMAKLSLVFI